MNSLKYLNRQSRRNRSLGQCKNSYFWDRNSPGLPLTYSHKIRMLTTLDLRQVFLARNKLLSVVNLAQKNQQMMLNSSIEEMLARLIATFVSIAKKQCLMGNGDRNGLKPKVVVSVLDEIPSAKRHMYLVAGQIAGFDEKSFLLVNESTAIALAHLYGVAQARSIDSENDWGNNVGMEEKRIKSLPADSDYICVMMSKEQALKPAFKCTLFQVEQKRTAPTDKAGGRSLQLETLDAFDFDQKWYFILKMSLVNTIRNFSDHYKNLSKWEF